MAFNFFKTVDEITESQALDTDLKTWAGAQAWKLSNEDEAVDLSVDYDFEPENVKEVSTRLPSLPQDESLKFTPRIIPRKDRR